MDESCLVEGLDMKPLGVLLYLNGIQNVAMSTSAVARLRRYFLTSFLWRPQDRMQITRMFHVRARKAVTLYTEISNICNIHYTLVSDRGGRRFTADTLPLISSPPW